MDDFGAPMQQTDGQD